MYLGLIWVVVLFRYDANTVLTLLQEVSSYPDAKIDWDEMVRSTATGISNAREYQMLWRHLAYRDDLSENLEDGAEPMVCMALLAFKFVFLWWSVECCCLADVQINYSQFWFGYLNSLSWKTCERRFWFSLRLFWY